MEEYVSFVIADELVEATGLSEGELRLEIAVTLFAAERLTLGQASRLAEIPQAGFLRELGARKIPVHYDVEALEDDLRTIEELRRS